MKQWINGPRISRENNYNILRIIGAVAVMYGHMFVLMGSEAPTLYANEVNAIGFKILMVLSGYMITQSCIYETGVIRYTVKRIFRLFPALIVYTLVTIFLVGPILTKLPLGEYFTSKMTWEYLYNILLNPRFSLPGVFEKNPYPYAVNGSLWALPIEVSSYILVYIFLKVFGRFDKRKLLFGVVVLCVVVLQACHVLFFPSEVKVVWGTDWFRALSIYPYFFVGALYAVMNIKSYCNLQVAFVVFLLSIGINTNVYAIYECLAVFIIPYVLISLGECENPLFVSWFKNIDISYGMYLWGFLVQQILVQIIIVDVQYAISINVIFGISLLVTVVLSTLTWYLVERPASKVMKKIIQHI